MGSPVSGQGRVLQPVSVLKAIPPFWWDWFWAFAWGHPSLGQVCVGASHICSERRHCLRFSCVFLRDAVTLWVTCLFVTLDHERRITLVVVPSRCGHPFGSSGRIHMPSIGSLELLVAGGSPGLICCYARSLGYGSCPVVVRPLFALPLA